MTKSEGSRELLPSTRVAKVRLGGSISSLIIFYEDGEALFFKLPGYGLWPAMRILSGSTNNPYQLGNCILRDASKLEIKLSYPISEEMESSEFLTLVRKTFE